MSNDNDAYEGKMSIYARLDTDYSMYKNALLCVFADIYNMDKNAALTWFTEMCDARDQIRIELVKKSKEVSNQNYIFSLIKAERTMQDKLWGPIENHLDKPLSKVMPQSDAEQGWLDILMEEVIEVTKAKTDDDRKRELIQVAAVCVKWLEVLNHG
jgi:hypothetical protein